MTSFELVPDRFIPGALGPPGQRVFFVQSVSGAQVVSLRLEKQQVAALADYLAGILADLPVPEDEANEFELSEPVVAEWVVGSMGVAYDNDHDQMLVVAEEFVPVDEDTGEPEFEGSSARFRLTRGQVAGFVRQSARLMQGGRPSCRLCGLPMDPDGHVCPRNN